MYNKKDVSPSYKGNDRVTDEYLKLKLEYERSKRAIEEANIQSFMKEIQDLRSKSNATVEDYNRIFRLKRRIGRTNTFANQYYEWFKKNSGIGLSIYRASCNKVGIYYPVITYGEGLAKGMFLDFEDKFLRILKKSEFYNDYKYVIYDKQEKESQEILLKEVVQSIGDFIEFNNAEIDFKFTYNNQVISYPLFEKVDCVEYKGDVYSCRLVLNEDITEYLKDIVENNFIIESNIDTVDIYNADSYLEFSNVVNFNSKR